VLPSRLAASLSVLAVLALSYGCGQAAPQKASQAAAQKASASVTAQSGTPVLSVHVDRLRATVGEVITLTVSYRNASDKPYSLTYDNLDLLNVDVTDPSGRVVLDTTEERAHFLNIIKHLHLAPGASLSRNFSFRGKTPGRYDVSGLSLGFNGEQDFNGVGTWVWTPAVSVVVSL
jgi:uncharacterized repeat protein (TIGR01451 family)